MEPIDKESGMTSNPIYTYYIKKTREDENSYISKVSNQTNNFVFSELEQDTSYDIKVEVNGDKASNKGTGTLLNIITNKVGGATGDLTTGNIIASSPTWSSGTASIILTTITGLQIQYQVGSINGEWQTIESGAKVTGLSHNTTVYARLYDGTNYGDYGSVTIKDTTKPNAPTISLSGTEGTNSYYKSNVTVIITAGSDGQSGSNKIKYSVSGAQTVTETTTVEGTTNTSISITKDGTSTIAAYNR